jgi:hypothetical protein
MFENIVISINYVTNASFFYQTMGMTAATSIFIGAALYNGEVSQMWKGAIVLTTYTGLLLMTTMTRVFETLTNPNIPHNVPLAYAGAITIIFLTLYYILGMIIGVYTVQKARRK